MCVNFKTSVVRSNIGQNFKNSRKRKRNENFKFDLFIVSFPQIGLNNYGRIFTDFDSISVSKIEEQ